jgi:hypothetical protein
MEYDEASAVGVVHIRCEYGCIPHCKTGIVHDKQHITIDFLELPKEYRYLAEDRCE